MYSFRKTFEIMINMVFLMTIFIQPVLTEEGGKKMLPKDAILRLANADKDADELIQNIYPERAPFTLLCRFSEIMEYMPPECVRLLSEGVYFIYKFEQGNYLFVYYKSLEVDSYPLTWYLGKKLYLEDFEKLANEKATIQDVQSFDQYGNYLSLYMGYVGSSYWTFHHTVDGYRIRLDYIRETGKRIEIFKTTKLSNEDNPIYYNLLPIDKKLIDRVTP